MIFARMSSTSDRMYVYMYICICMYVCVCVRLYVCIVSRYLAFGAFGSLGTSNSSSHVRIHTPEICVCMYVLHQHVSLLKPLVASTELTTAAMCAYIHPKFVSVCIASTYLALGAFGSLSTNNYSSHVRIYAREINVCLYVLHQHMSL